MHIIVSIKNYIIKNIKEIAVRQADSVIYLLTSSKLVEKFKIHKGEISNELFKKLKNLKFDYNKDSCAGCKHPSSFIDRGVPLCSEHEVLHEKFISKREEPDQTKIMPPNNPINTVDCILFEE